MNRLPGARAPLLATLLVAAGAAHAANDGYEIAATLLHEGKAFATPTMVVRVDERAEVEVSGPDAYKLALTASAADADTVRIDASVESAHGSMHPVMVVRIGEPASVTVGKLALEFAVANHGITGEP